MVRRVRMGPREGLCRVLRAWSYFYRVTHFTFLQSSAAKSQQHSAVEISSILTRRLSHQRPTPPHRHHTSHTIEEETNTIRLAEASWEVWRYTRRSSVKI